jgi:uncharacterized protein with NAD-binding domain and iron-sulfur cluster
VKYGARIEEHGLHIWFGFYDNSFKIMKDAYKEMQRSPELPLSTFEEAFKGHDFVVLMDKYQGKWSSWAFDFETNDKVPGVGEPMPSLWTVAWWVLQWLRLKVQTEIIERFEPCTECDESQHLHKKEGWWDKIEHIVDPRQLHDSESVPAADMLQYVIDVLSHLVNLETNEVEHLVDNFIEDIADLLGKYRDWLWCQSSCHMDNETVREFLLLTDTALTWVIGLIKDNVHKKGIFSIDKWDLVDWMKRHGIHDESLKGPIVKMLYDNIFSYEDGDANKPNVASGTALLWAIRMVLTYKGHVMYKMQAGMGDTVFTPFYQVLLNRGVKFKFFHCVQNLGINSTNDAIETIQIMPQADLISDQSDQYDPLILVKGLPCWPDQPNWNQLKDGERLRHNGVNFEQQCVVDPGREPLMLKKGEDFDLVILGIPIAANKSITQELYKNNPAWREMHDRVKTVQTRAYQVWFNKTLEELNFIYQESPVLGSYVEENFDTYADMSQLIPSENQPASDNVQNIAYWCQAMPDTPTQEEADENAKCSAYTSFTADMPLLWKNLVDDDGNIRWDWLVNYNNKEGKACFDGQFFRANWTPTERYTLSLANTTQYRIKTDATGYNNLYIVGDWIDNNFNSGCIEACTMSGMQASRAICGYPKVISGEDEDGWAKPTSNK